MMELGSGLQVLLGRGEVDATLRPWCVHVQGPLPQNAITWGAGPQQFVFSCLEGKVSGRAILPPCSEGGTLLPLTASGGGQKYLVSLGL